MMGLSWDIPKDWGTRLLEDIAPEDSSQITPANHPQETFNYWGLDAIAKNQFAEPLPNYVSGADIQSTCVQFDERHVLYCKLRPYLNKVIIPSIAGIGSTEWIPLKPAPNVLDREFLAFVLRSPQFVNYISANVAGARMPRARKSVLWKTPIPIPYPDDPARSLAEQRRIVARLEALLGEVREMRELAEEMEKDIGRVMESALAEVFSDKERAKWENEKPLGELVTITAPLVDPTLPKYRDLPHINGERIEESTGRLLPYNTAAQDGMKSSKYFFQPGDVLYSKIRPYLRKATTVDFSGVCSADMYPLQVVNEELLPEFLKWGLLSRHFTEYAVGLSRRARMPKLNRKQLFAYRLCYPSKPTQQVISAHLDQVLREVILLKDTENENSQQLAQLEQSILAAAFRGEL